VVLGISIAVLVLPGLPAIRAANFRPFLTDGWSGFGSALPPLFFAYAGFESLAHAAGEVRQSTSTLPRVFLRGILFTTLVFVSMSAVTQGVLSSQAMAASSAPMAEAAAVYLPAGASLLVAIGAVFAVATSLNATLFVPSRLMIVLAEDGLLPRTLGRVSSSRGTPGIGLCLTTLAAAMLVLSGQISLSLNLAVLALVLLYALQALALLLLPRMRPEVLREAKVRLSPAVMRAAALFSLLSMVGLAASQVLTDMRHISGTGIVERIRGQSLTGTELAIAWGALGMLVYLTSARHRVPGGRSAPAAQELAGCVELEDRRRRVGALGLGDGTRPVQDPDVIVRVDRDRRHLAEHPVIGNRRPGRIDLELRGARLGAGGDQPGDDSNGKRKASKHGAYDTTAARS
jgi:amino acid transporter